MKRLTAVLLSVFLLAVSVLAASGDVNGDDELNNKDVVSLFRYVSGDKNAVEDESACDINGDGGIDNKDVVSLFRNVSSGAVPSETDEQRETEKEISEEVEEETEIEISEEVEETSERVTQTDKEPEKGREFKSVQSSHETPYDIEQTTNVYAESPFELTHFKYLGGYTSVEGQGILQVCVRVVDVGYAQFFSFPSWGDKSGMSDGMKILRNTDGRYKNFKVWLCDIDHNKIDYVYPNTEGYALFELRPGTYTFAFDDIEGYTVAKAPVIKFGEEIQDGRYVIDYSEAKDMRVMIYDSSFFGKVNIKVTDDMTGAPVENVKVYINGSSENPSATYALTDKNGQVKADSIFEYMYNFSENSSGAGLRFEKDGYDLYQLKDLKPQDTDFNIKLHKSEVIEYTVRVINESTGEPIKGVSLDAHGHAGDTGIFYSDENGIIVANFTSYDYSIGQVYFRVQYEYRERTSSGLMEEKSAFGDFKITDRSQLNYTAYFCVDKNNTATGRMQFIIKPE